jgi:hypothetical protein
MGRDGHKTGNGRAKRRDSKLRFYGNNFVLDTVSGRFYRLSPIAGFVLKALAGGTDPDRLVEIVEKKFGADHAKVARHVELFLSDLNSLELIENPAY